MTHITFCKAIKMTESDEDYVSRIYSDIFQSCDSETDTELTQRIYNDIFPLDKDETNIELIQRLESEMFPTSNKLCFPQNLIKRIIKQKHYDHNVNVTSLFNFIFMKEEFLKAYSNLGELIVEDVIEKTKRLEHLKVGNADVDGIPHAVCTECYYKIPLSRRRDMKVHILGVHCSMKEQIIKLCIRYTQIEEQPTQIPYTDLLNYFE